MGEEQSAVLEPLALIEPSLVAEQGSNSEPFLDEQLDSVAIFLEKHGSDLTRNHKGELITYYRAVEECPALPMLIRALGEGALALTAATRTESEEELENTNEIDEETVDGLEEKPETEKSAQKSGSIERAEQRITKKEAVNVPDAIKGIAGQEAVTPAKAAAANKSLSEKSGISQEGEASSGTAQAAAVSGSSTQKVKAETFSIPEMSQGIIKAAHPTIEAESTRDTESAAVTQEAPALSFPALAKNTYVSGGGEIGEAHDTTSPLENKDEVILIEKNQEQPLAEDEEHQIIPGEAHGDFFLEEIADPEAEVFLESELIKVNEQWANDEVVRLREIGADEESSTASVLLTEINNTGTAEVLPAEKVEQTIIELVERIESTDTEKAEMVYEILDKIALKVETIIAPLQVVERDQEDDESSQVKLGVVEIEAKLEEELRGLFIELFDYVGMEHSPELIEAFTKLALKIDILNLIPKTELMEKSVPDPSQGTHEIIKQLLGALTAIKQTAERAYAIGKGVLLLYRHQLASA